MLSQSDLPHYTYSDYLHWEGRWELIEGIAHAMSPAPSVSHQKVSQEIARLLGESMDHCEQCHALLPVDWKITEDTIVQPDNLIVCYQPTGNYITRAPSVIFEVLSPSTRRKDERVKFRLYESAGVKYYCLVDLEEKLIKFYQLKDDSYVKLLETKTETICFDLAECEIEFDCSKVWR